MTPEELAPVWAAYWAGDLEAHDILVRQFLPLANYHARQALAKAPPHQDPGDIYSYAHRGLLDAITKFRPDGGAKFETYASRRIPGAIKDGQRNDDPLNRNSRRNVRSMESAVDESWSVTGRAPSVREVSELSGLDEDSVRTAILEQQSLNASLDALVEGGHEGLVEGDADVVAQLTGVRTAVAERLAQLPGRERAFALLYYVENLPMADTQEQLDIGSDWCSRTKRNVLEAVSRR